MEITKDEKHSKMTGFGAGGRKLHQGRERRKRVLMEEVLPCGAAGGGAVRERLERH